MPELITIADLYDIEWLEDPRISPDGAWIAYVRVTPDRTRNTDRRAIWLATPEGECKQFTAGTHQDHTPRWSPDGKTLAFVSTRSDDKPQIYLIPVDGGEARPLTSMPSGATEPAWSPNGSQIAFLSRVHEAERAKEDAGEEEEPPADPWEAKRRKEQRKHEEEERVDPRVITRLPYRSGTSFLDGRHSHIYVISVQTEEDEGKPRRLTDGDIDFGPPAWTTDGQAILSHTARDPEADSLFLHQDLVRIDVASGAMERLSHDDRFTDFAPRPSLDGRWIAYTRMPEERPLGWGPRLAVMPAAGTSADARDLSLVLDRPIEDFRWSPDSQVIYFNVEDQGNTHLYRVALNSSEPERILDGTRSIDMFDVPAWSASGDHPPIAFVASTPTAPSDLYLRTPAGAEQPLTQINADYLAEKATQTPEEVRFTAPDGQAIQGWIVKPPNFDPSHKYPMIVDIHGGPHVMWGPNFRTLWHEWQVFAARGYVVFFCNPRGSEGYGHAFQDAIHDNWGYAEGPDILAGIDHVVSQGYVDPDRMCVTGGSYGGYMTTWLVGHDDRFAAAATQRGVYNLTSFYGTSDAFELIEVEFDGDPWSITDKLHHHSPLAYAPNIHTPLLILHSEQDYRVPISDAEQLFAVLRRLGREVQFVRYPREGHELSRSGEPKHRVDRLQRIVGWFDRYCKKSQESVPEPHP